MASKSNNRVSTVLEIYKQYYASENTPETIVSSHWKYYHKKVAIKIENDQIKSLYGAGFGDIPNAIRISSCFDWLTIISYLTCSSTKSELIALIRTAINVVRRMGLVFSYDCFRQVCSLHLLMQHLKQQTKLKVLIIGDGYGVLSALIKQIYPDSSLFLVDLGKTLLFQSYYCNKAHPECSHSLVSQDNNMMQKEESDFIYCPAEHIVKLDGISFDIAINIASMQEMNQETIKTYFDFLRRNMQRENLFYCCNRENKKMPGGEVSKFLLYPWHEKDKNIIDENCPWHKYFYSVHTLKNGPKLFQIRIPFINYFDGVHRHRLTVLHRNSN